MTARTGTAAAPANIAFVKYWGARDVERGLPLNPSISMTLSTCRSICTARFHPAGPGEAERGGAARASGDEVLLAAEDGSLSPAPRRFAAPVLVQLQRVRRWAGVEGRFRVATRNTFPGAAGLASSASGFAALTLAAARAAGRRPSPEELSDLARRSGSGSAARSAFGGYVEWPARWAWEVRPAAGEVRPAARTGEGRPRPGLAPEPGGAAPLEGEETAAARPLASHEHWDLRNVIAVVDAGPKGVSSREGHRRVPTSPYFETRLALLPARLDQVRRAIAERDFEGLAPVLEAEGVDLHFLAMSARPPIHYWTPGTVEVLAAVRALRDDGVPAAWTMDAGPNVHVICPPDSEDAVAERLGGLGSVRSLIRDRVGPGPTTEVPSLLPGPA